MTEKFYKIRVVLPACPNYIFNMRALDCAQCKETGLFIRVTNDHFYVCDDGVNSLGRVTVLVSKSLKLNCFQTANVQRITETINDLLEPYGHKIEIVKP